MTFLPRRDEPSLSEYFNGRVDPRYVLTQDRMEAVHVLVAQEQRRASGMAYDARLRRLERHGGGQMLERAFAGFEALPDPKAARPWWYAFGQAARPAWSLEDLEREYRERAWRLHPDRGGSDEQMAALNVARDRALQDLLPVGAA